MLRILETHYAVSCLRPPPPPKTELSKRKITTLLSHLTLRLLMSYIYIYIYIWSTYS